MKRFRLFSTSEISLFAFYLYLFCPSGSNPTECWQLERFRIARSPQAQLPNPISSSAPDLNVETFSATISCM